MKLKNYYKILQVDSNATSEELKQAYHRLAHKYHPDVSQEPEAEQKFKEVKEAYEVLKDPHKRAIYTTRFKTILPYTYEWFISKRNAWLHRFAQQSTHKSIRARLQRQRWKSLKGPVRVQTATLNSASVKQQQFNFTTLAKYLAIATIFMLLGVASYIGFQHVQDWRSHQQLQAALLQHDETAISTLEQAHPTIQQQILQNAQVKPALITYYLQHNNPSVFARLTSFDTAIVNDILTDKVVYSLVKKHYYQKIASEVEADNFSTAFDLLEQLLNNYPSSQEFAQKYEEIYQQKQQRLAQLTQQYLECLDQTLAPLLERTHCMVEARQKIEQVGIEHSLPNDPNLAAMYAEEIKHALAEKNYNQVEKLLLDWENLITEPTLVRKQLWENLTLHRQFNDIVADLSNSDPNKIAIRLSQLTIDQKLQQEILAIPQVQKNLVHYHLNEALRVLNNKTAEVKIDSQVSQQMKKIITASLEPPAKKATPAPSKTTASATEERVAQLLPECQTHYQAYRLTTGAPGTAFDCYHTVLKLDPGNRHALNGLNAIQNRYLAWIESAFRQNKPSKARAYLTGLQKVNPKLPALTRLKARLKQATSSPPQVVKKSPPKKSPKLSPKKTSPPPASEPLANNESTCEGCTCSKLLKQLSMGVKPLTSAQRSFFQSQCR